MYKWHVNSAIGRGRPLTNDFSRVADGIAASLRQFSISLSRAEDGDAPRPTRAQRGAEAAKDILTPQRGIDARALAAKPTQGFTIRRVNDAVDERPSRPAGFIPRGRGGLPGDRGGRGGFTPRGRGGTGMRGRGAAGRGRGGKRPRRSKPNDDDEDALEDPLNDEELAWLAGNDGGWPTPYIPKTSLEQLMGKGTLGMASSRGLLETAAYKMQVGTDNVNGPHRHAEEHLARINRGHGTLFESTDAKAITEKFLSPKARKEIHGLPESEKEKLSKAWIAGHYDGPAMAEKGDVLGQVEAYARRNETYLPEDSRKLQAKLASLLTSVTPPKPTSSRAQKSR